MALHKIPVNTKWGSCELTESRIKLTMPGASKNPRLLHKFVQLTDLHITDTSPEDSLELVELSKARAEFWQNQGGFFTYDEKGEIANKLFPVEVIEVVADRIREIAPELVLFTGDTVDFPSASNFRCAGEYLRNLGTEYVFVPGNHDHMGEDSDERTIAAYKEYIGELKPYSVTSLEDLDIFTANDGFVKVTDEQVDALRAQIETGRPTIVLLHAPVLTDSAKWPVRKMWGYTWMVGEENQPQANYDFLRLLNENRGQVLAVFAGHVHRASGDGEGLEHGEEFSPEEVLQYTAAPAFTGFLRVIEIYG